MNFKTRLNKSAHYHGLKTFTGEETWVFFGAPFDGTSSYRAGSRFAPDAIRQETHLCQEEYSPYFNKELSEVSIADVGNIELPFGNTKEALKQIYTFSKEVISQNKSPFMVGGEHLVSLPVIKSTFEKYPDLHVIHLDAHADMIDELFGESYSHGTVMRRVWDFLGDGRIFQFGIRSGSKDELQFAKKHAVLNPFSLDGIDQHLDKLQDVPIYLTIDLDCFDPSQIPGTGTPETGGIFFKEFISFLRKISHLNFVGIDVNELAPRIDPTGMSTVFAGKVIRETIVSCIKEDL